MLLRTTFFDSVRIFAQPLSFQDISPAEQTTIRRRAHEKVRTFQISLHNFRKLRRPQRKRCCPVLGLQR